MIKRNDFLHAHALFVKIHELITAFFLLFLFLLQSIFEPLSKLRRSFGPSRFFKSFSSFHGRRDRLLDKRSSRLAAQRVLYGNILEMIVFLDYGNEHRKSIG